MKPFLRNLTLATIFGLTTMLFVDRLPSKAATLDSNTQMMDIDLGTADAFYDLRFIDSMTEHHQGAIDMARDALGKSERIEILELSQDIIIVQNLEIEQLMQWRMEWYPNADNMSVGDGMMNMDLGTADAFYDLRFINAMTMHHQSAIEMARDALGKSKRTEILELSQDIITAQMSEIEQMKEWKMAWYPDAINPDMTSVPEPTATAGLLTLGVFAIGSAAMLKRKHHRLDEEKK